jgi:hypothetical protein
VVGAVLAVLVVVGAALAAVTLLGGTDGDLAEGGHLAKAVTSEPEEAWTFDTDGEYAQVSTAGDVTVVSVGDSGEVVALDEHGEELWTADDADYGWAYVLPGDDDLVVVQGQEGYGFGVLTTDDGDELWYEDSGGSVMGLVDGRLVVSSYDDGDSTSEIEVRDPRSGDEEWSVSRVGSSQVTKDAIYVVRSGDLVRLDPGSGDEKWSVDLGLGGDDYSSLTVVDGLAVVSTDEVHAYSTEDGEELWSEDASSSDASLTVGAFSSDSVYVDESLYTDDENEETVRVFDEDGEVGELDIDEDESFYGQGLRSGGEDFFLSFADGTLYDDSLDRVASYDGQLQVADSGLYSLDGDELLFYEYGERSESWAVDVDDAEEATVFAGDHVVFILADGTLTAYR